MHVTLELKTGSEAGRQVHLVSHQRVCVGCSPWADFVLRGEPGLAERHFVLETDSHACRVRDVSQGHGLLLNQESILSAVVHHGDSLRAGAAEFVLTVEGEVRDSVPEPVVSGQLPPPPARARPGVTPTYRREQFESGVLRYQGASAELAPAVLVKRLSEMQPVFVLAELRSLAAPPDPLPAETSYLFDWLGQAAAENSPLLLDQRDTDIPRLIEESWQRNALVCLFSAAGKQELLLHLRERAKLGPGQILGICWPHTLGPLLERYHREFAEAFLKPLHAVLLENGERPEVWSLYSWQPCDEILTQLGLERAEIEPE